MHPRSSECVSIIKKHSRTHIHPHASHPYARVRNTHSYARTHTRISATYPHAHAYKLPTHRHTSVPEEYASPPESAPQSEGVSPAQQTRHAHHAPRPHHRRPAPQKHLSLDALGGCFACSPWLDQAPGTSAGVCSGAAQQSNEGCVSSHIIRL